MKACDATPTCVAGVPTAGVDSCCKQGECDPSPTCTAGGLEPGVNNCCHVCDGNPECQVGSEFPGIDTCCKPPPPPDYDGTPGNCDANPSCQPGVPDLGKNTCCPDNAACDTTPECIPGGTVPGVDTCCADTCLVKQKSNKQSWAPAKSKRRNKIHGKAVTRTRSASQALTSQAWTTAAKTANRASRPRAWTIAPSPEAHVGSIHATNGMKNDQINEVIQKESKHIEQTAEEKEQQRQQMMLELKNRIKEEMARKERSVEDEKSAGEIERESQSRSTAA